MNVDPASLIRTSHLGDVTVMSLRAGYDHGELVDRATRELAAGGRLVLDFHGSPADPAARGELLRRIVAGTAGAPGTLAVVERAAADRATWRELGIEVHESLDDAVGDVAPAVLDGPPQEHLAPAQGDATLVATDDVSGNPTTL